MRIRRLIREEHGQGMTEYGLVLGVIAVVVATVLVALKTEITQLYNETVQQVINRQKSDSVPS